MDPYLLSKIQEHAPKMNQQVMEGVSYHQMQQTQWYVDRVFQCAAANFPPGLHYDGYRVCDPVTEFRETTKPRDNKRQLELARNDFYLVGYHFIFTDEEGNEEPLVRYIYLPFVQEGGLTYVNGRRFVIHPVLSDPGYSLGATSLFIQMTRIRFTFERTTHHFYANDERQMCYVVWSWIHSRVRERQKNRSPNASIVYSTLVNYLLVVYGFTQMMEEFAGVQATVGTVEEITPEHYPTDEWVICSSAGNKPRGWRGGNNYRPPNVRVAIPRDQWNSQARSLLGGVFYILDNFSHQVTARDMDDAWMWKIILGTVICGPGNSQGLLAQEIDSHLQSLAEYMDPMVVEDMRENGVYANNIYELFMFIIETLADKTVSTDTGISSIYGKRLTTLRYVLYDIVSGINLFMFNLRNVIKKRGRLTADDVKEIMRTFLRPRSIAAISNKQRHPEVSSLNTSSDNLFFGATSMMITQDNASASKSASKRKINLHDPGKHLHASIAEVGSLTNLPKSDPTGRSRINPFVKLTPDGRVQRQQKFISLLDFAQQKISQ